MADPLVKAASWTSDLLLGPLATSVCVVAIASIGAVMLSGRIDQKRALTALIACFLIFGASSIANGLLFGIGDAQAPARDDPPLAVPVPQAKASPDFDPYAGASPLPRPVSKAEARSAP